MRGYWVGVLSAFGIGLVVGGTAVRILVEEKIAKEYDESVESITRAYEMALNNQPLTDKDMDFDLEYNRVAMPDTEHVIWDPKDITEYEQKASTYHTPVVDDTTPVNVFVEGTPNQFGISYLEEEDFDEDDGRNKHHVTMVVDPETMDVTFFMMGQVIEDAFERLGPGIVGDFIEHVPHTLPNQILYVRNHQTDEDYEVVRELP